MKFGLFTSAQANSGDLGPETGQGFRDYLDFNVAAERLGFVSLPQTVMRPLIMK